MNKLEEQRALKTAREQGVDARLSSKQLAANPYSSCVQYSLWKAWLDGWCVQFEMDGGRFVGDA